MYISVQLTPDKCTQASNTQRITPHYHSFRLLNQPLYCWMEYSLNNLNTTLKQPSHPHTSRMNSAVSEISCVNPHITVTAQSTTSYFHPINLNQTLIFSDKITTPQPTSNDIVTINSTSPAPISPPNFPTLTPSTHQTQSIFTPTQADESLEELNEILLSLAEITRQQELSRYNPPLSSIRKMPVGGFDSFDYSSLDTTGLFCPSNPSNQSADNCQKNLYKSAKHVEWQSAISKSPVMELITPTETLKPTIINNQPRFFAPHVCGIFNPSSALMRTGDKSLMATTPVLSLPTNTPQNSLFSVMTPPLPLFFPVSLPTTLCTRPHPDISISPTSYTQVEQERTISLQNQELELTPIISHINCDDTHYNPPHERLTRNTRSFTPPSPPLSPSSPTIALRRRRKSKDIKEVNIDKTNSPPPRRRGPKTTRLSWTGKPPSSADPASLSPEELEVALTFAKKEVERQIKGGNSSTAGSRALSHVARTILFEYFIENFTKPYPSAQEIEELEERTGLTATQIQYFFVNQRTRLLKPAVYHAIRIVRENNGEEEQEE